MAADSLRTWPLAEWLGVDLDCDLIRAIGQEDVWAGLRVVPIVGPTLHPPITPRSLLEVMTAGVRAALLLLTWWNLVPLACPDTGVCRHSELCVTTIGWLCRSRHPVCGRASGRCGRRGDAVVQIVQGVAANPVAAGSGGERRTASSTPQGSCPTSNGN